MKIRFVKGTITKTTGGNHNIYTNGSIVDNAGRFITETAGNSHTYGEPKDAPERENFPKVADQNISGYFYTKEGKYLGKIESSNNVCITDELTFLDIQMKKTVDKSKIIFFTEVYGLNNEQMLDRANWAYAEGRGYAPEYYAYSMNNFQKVAKNEKNMYFYGMQDTDPDTGKVRRLDKIKYLSGGYENQSGKPFWDARKKLLKMTDEMIGEIAAVFKTQLQPEKDPTNGSNQWRGGKGSGEMQLNLPVGSKFWHRFFKLKKEYSGQAKIVTL